MGCCFSRRPVLHPLPPLPANVVRLHPTTDPELLSEACECIILSFMGTATTAPEADMSWAFFGDARPRHAAPLEPEFVDAPGWRTFVTFIMRLTFYGYLRRGGCFALLAGGDGDGDGSGPGAGKLKVAAATICVPPNDHRWHIRDTDPVNLICLGMLCRLGMPPRSVLGFLTVTGARCDVLVKTMHLAHHRHAPGRHWYVGSFAVHPAFQGRGNGKAFLRDTICALGDHDDVPCYLETVGARNKGFYGHVGGFEVHEHCVIAYKGSALGDDGGTAMMVRLPGGGMDGGMHGGMHGGMNGGPGTRAAEGKVL